MSRLSRRAMCGSALIRWRGRGRSVPRCATAALRARQPTCPSVAVADVGVELPCGAGGEVGDFTVTAWGTGSSRETGRIAVAGDHLGLEDGGVLLRHVVEADGRNAIMGDSYSSGEGAGDYLPSTDTTDEWCHRSLGTYLSDHIEAEQNIACSVIEDFDSPKVDREHGLAQLAHLDGMSPAPDIVFLTIGGTTSASAKSFWRACRQVTAQKAPEALSAGSIGPWRPWKSPNVRL